MVEATSVVMGGKVYTMDSMFHTYDDGAVAICNGTIVWVGEAPELDVNVNMQNATIVDAQGHPIMPGLIDSHMHPLLAGNIASYWGFICLANPSFRHRGTLVQLGRREFDGV